MCSSDLVGGTITFDAIPYTQADIGRSFTYTIKEVQGSEGGVTYDGSEYRVDVEVAVDTADPSKLIATPTIYKVKDDKGLAIVNPSSITTIGFSNTYEAAGSLELKAKKDLSGKPLTDNSFSFTLNAGTDELQRKGNVGGRSEERRVGKECSISWCFCLLPFK